MSSREWMRTRNIRLFITLTLIVCAVAITYYVPISKTSLSDIMTMPNSDKLEYWKFILQNLGEENGLLI